MSYQKSFSGLGKRIFKNVFGDKDEVNINIIHKLLFKGKNSGSSWTSGWELRQNTAFKKKNFMSSTNGNTNILW